MLDTSKLWQTVITNGKYNAAKHGIRPWSALFSKTKTIFREKHNYNFESTNVSLDNILLEYSTFMQYIHCKWIQDLTVSYKHKVKLLLIDLYRGASQLYYTKAEKNNILAYKRDRLKRNKFHYVGLNKFILY